MDGTKVLANASKHAAGSYERAGETIQQLELEVPQLLAKAEQADITPLEDGLSIPEEIVRRQERKAVLAKAPSPPSSAPKPREQSNFTDPESRIMKAGSGEHFEQAYNAPAAVEVESRLIVGQCVSASPNDQQELVPTMASIPPEAGSVAAVLTDSGFFSEAAVQPIEQTQEGTPTGTTGYAPLDKTSHHRSVADWEKKPEPAPPPEGASVSEVMRHRLKTGAGKALYKLRQQTGEPVLGIIKAAVGFRQFLMRGVERVSLEWTLVCLAYNFRRLHTLGAGAKLRG